MSTANENSLPTPLSAIPLTPSKESPHERLFDKVKKVFPSATETQDLIGTTMFTVGMDDSPALRALTKTAHSLRDLPFAEKLAKIQEITIGALPENAVEMAGNGNQAAQSLVFDPTHPLSDALAAHSGCCRYQGALFFMLGREAQLGSQHYLLTQSRGSMFTVYNVVYDNEGNRHLVSIYNQTLTPDGKEKHGYPEPTHTEPIDFAKGHPYFAYFQSGNEQVAIQTTVSAASEKRSWGVPIQI